MLRRYLHLSATDPEELSFAIQSLSTESEPAKKQEATAEVRTLIGKVENLESQAPRRPQNARIDLQKLLTAVPEHKALMRQQCNETGCCSSSLIYVRREKYA